ncbi:dual specificity protein phosphatase family protein [uncultured Shewanella sp.]|uniref:dual specificity protein phosphatase family protein n=1 Tax=uncultured Shewanella sp. TaxID=173975 RepID=UPI00261EA910|nr:dual specificity protein phosphatase family protein [uncultured Shewanella sp.]
MSIAFNSPIHNQYSTNDHNINQSTLLNRAHITTINAGSHEGYQFKQNELNLRGVLNDSNVVFSFENELDLVNAGYEAVLDSNTQMDFSSIIEAYEQAQIKTALPIQIIDKDEYQFNAHVAPGGCLMSTSKPNGDLSAYASMLKSYDVGVLISIDAFAPEGLTAELNIKGIEHINEATYFIEDFFSQGALPKNKLSDIVDKIREYESQGQNVAIHCGAGDGRSGTVKSAYMLDKIVTEHSQSNNLSNEQGTVNTHYYQTDITQVAKSVSDAVLAVRSEGHHRAVERPEDVYALQDMYQQMMA